MAGPYHGTWVAGVPGGFTPGPSGFGQVFSQGGTAYVQLPDNPGPLDFAAGASWTVELRVRTTRSSGTYVAVGHYNGGSTGSLWIGVQNGNAHASVNGFTDISGPSIADGTWHTLAVCVSTGTTARFFVDGTLAGTQTGTWVAGNATANIGTFGNQASYAWGGDLDEVAIYSAALYSTTYTPATAPVAANALNLVSVYHLDGDLLDGAGAPQMGTISVSSSGGTDTITYLAATAGTNPIAGYALYLGNASNAEFGLPLATASGSGGGTFTHQTPPGATSYYWVRAYDNAATAAYSGPSNEVSASGGTGTVIAPNNAAILYSPFNWDVGASAARAINGGAYLRVRFTGTSVGVAWNMSGLASSALPQYVASVDGLPWQTFSAAAVQSLFSGLPNAGGRAHILELAVRAVDGSLNRWTAPQTTVLAIQGLYFDAGQTVSAPQRRPKNVLVYGDSISEGVNAAGGNSLVSNVADMDGTRCYAYLLGRLLDAEVGVVAFGGIGWTSGGVGGVPTVPNSYNLLWAGHSRSFSSPAPDLVIYLVGFNDSGASAATVQGAAQTVINAILAAAPQSKHLVIPTYNAGAANCNTGLAQAVSALATSNVVLGTVPVLAAGDLGDGIHPTAYAHIEKMAPQIAAQALPLLDTPTVTAAASFAQLFGLDARSWPAEYAGLPRIT